MSELSDLNYVKQVLVSAKRNDSYPLIYLLWGCIVLAGFTVAEFRPTWINRFWLVATPIGMVGSAALGMLRDKQSGQTDAILGRLYFRHFALVVIAVFIAVLTNQQHSILLLIGLGYAIAGVHLDRTMLWIGLLTLLVHIAVFKQLINSSLVVGIVISAGLFLAAWNARAQGADA